MLPPVSIELLDLWFQVKHYPFSALIWHVLFWISLNFCSHTTWSLDLDDLDIINRAWVYKEPKVSVLQADTKLVKKG